MITKLFIDEGALREPLLSAALKLEEIARGDELYRQKLDRIRAEVVPVLAVCEGQEADLFASAILDLVNEWEREKQYRAGMELIELAASLAVDAEIKHALLQRLEHAKYNWSIMGCYFCDKSMADPKDPYIQYMFANAKWFLGLWQFNRKKVPIPRCHFCEKRHGSATGTYWILWIGTAILFCLPSVFINPESSLFWFVFGMWPGHYFGKLIERSVNKASGMAHPYRYPEIRRLRAEGWRHGRRPNLFTGLGMKK